MAQHQCKVLRLVLVAVVILNNAIVPCNGRVVPDAVLSPVKGVVTNPRPTLPGFLTSAPAILPSTRPLPLKAVDLHGLPFTSPGNSSDGYVIGGQPTGRGKWPWVVSIDYNDMPTRTRVFVCGGVLIHSATVRWVLTAAHCVSGEPPQLFVSLGVYNQTAQDYVNRIPVKQIILHEGFDFSTKKDDLALLELWWQPDLDDILVDELELPNAWNKWLTLQRQCYIVGWGRYDLDIPNLSEVLLERNVSVLSNHQCQSRWNESFARPAIHDSNVCVDEVDGVSSCQGDSGSPLHCQLTTGQWVVAGISSWGSSACSTYPSVFTRITSYLDWIEDAIQKKWADGEE